MAEQRAPGGRSVSRGSPRASERRGSVEVAPVRAGEDLDWPRLDAYLRANIAGLDGPFSVLQFPNGSANLTYLVRIGDTELVVRRPPFGRLAPRAYLFCDDHDVIGSDFLVVEYRRGVVMWDHVPAAMAEHDDAARRIGFAVVDALADLHLV